MKKLTVTELLKQKEKYQVKDDVKEELYIERLEATITVKKPNRSLCLEVMQMSQDDNQATKADVFLVYNIVVEPNLKDAQLQKEFGCVEPTDIVEKIFEAGEVAHISQEGLDLAGFAKGVTKVKDLKN